MRINRRTPTIICLCAIGSWWGAGDAFAAPAEPTSATEQQPDDLSSQAGQHIGRIWHGDESESAESRGACSADALHLPVPELAPTIALSPPASAAVCQAAVAVAVSLGCAAISVSCASGTVLTVGSLAIPCVLLTALACGAGAGAASIVAAYCPDLVRR